MGMDDYIILKKIGAGSFGTVYKTQDRKTGKIVAMKQVLLRSSISHREINLLKNLRHENIVLLEDVFHHGNYMYLIFELLLMDLKQYIRQVPNGVLLNPQLIKSYLYQINCAVLYCHQRRVLHRDLKPANLLITRNGYIKIADFGVSRAFGYTVEAFTQPVGTLCYCAPELLLGATEYWCPVDMWAVGCIFAQMITKKVLFVGTSQINLLMKIFYILGTPTEEIWPGVSSYKDYQPVFPRWKTYRLSSYVVGIDAVGMDLLKRMFIYNPDNRISAQRALAHPYFNNLDRRVLPVFYNTNK